MLTGKLSGLAALFAVLALSACASTASQGVTSAANEPTYVGLVEVVQPGADASATFAERVRTAVLAESAFYGSAGRPINLKIELDKVHFKNPLKAMIIGDTNVAKGRVAVIDPATGQQLATFAVQVDAERPSAAGTGASIGLMVAEVFDPTGAVGYANMAGNAGSATINRGGTAAAMSLNFASETLRQTFGDTKTKAAKAAKKTAARTPG